MLHVKAPAPDFWRGSAFDLYDGRTWTRSAELAASGPSLEILGDDDVSAEMKAFNQTVRVEAAAIGTIFAAPIVVDVNLPPRSFESADSGLRLDVPLGRGAQYVARSYRPIVTGDVLRNHDPRSSGVPSVLESYVSAGGATPKVADLAQQIAGDAPTTYDAIQSIEDWLGENTKYTLDIPPLPQGADAVEQYLFVDKRGFCVQIASSLTVMLRSLGVPARLATGFAPGQESLLGGDFTVRAKDAHAWVEVWFPGVGWQGFDPTAHVPLSGDYSTSAPARIGRFLARIAIVLLMAVALVAAADRRCVGEPSSPASVDFLGVAVLRADREGGRQAGSPTRAFRDSGRVCPRTRQLGDAASGDG